MLTNACVIAALLFHGQVISWALLGLGSVFFALTTLSWLLSRKSE